MAGTIVQFGTDDLYRALEGFDPVATLIDELVTRTEGCPGWGWQQTVQLNSLVWSDAAQSPGPYDQGACGGCLVPATDLRTVRVAALAALAAQRLLTPSVVTAAVLGSGTVAQLEASIIARCVPDVSHVALWPASGRCPALRLVDQLDLAGIGLSVTERADDAMRGANLVIFACPPTRDMRAGQFARGAVVINGMGSELPADLVGGADQLYVDYADLLCEDRRRYVVVPGAACGARRAGQGHRHNPGWLWRVEADLVQVMTGTHPGRTDPDHILLVDLLSANSLSAGLADQFRRAALRHGFGT